MKTIQIEYSQVCWFRETVNVEDVADWYAKSTGHKYELDISDMEEVKEQAVTYIQNEIQPIPDECEEEYNLAIIAVDGVSQ